MRFEHLALQVEDPVAMGDWYVRHLGMRIVQKGDQSPFGRFLADAGGRVVLELYRNPSFPVPDYSAINPAHLHVAFAVEDLEASRRVLAAAGARPVGEVTVTPAGDRVAMFRDPWGLPLQLVRRAKPLGG